MASIPSPARRRLPPSLSGAVCDPAVVPFLIWGARRRRWSESTCENYGRRTLRFLRWCKANGVRPQRATTADVWAHLDEQHPSVAVHTSVRTALAAYFDYLVDQGTVAANPVGGVARYPVRRTLPKAINQAAAANLLAVAATRGLRWHLYVALLLYAGLRRNEARTLEWSGLERDSDGGHWLRLVGKGGFERVIPCTPRSWGCWPAGGASAGIPVGCSPRPTSPRTRSATPAAPSGCATSPTAPVWPTSPPTPPGTPTRRA